MVYSVTLWFEEHGQAKHPRSFSVAGDISIRVVPQLFQGLPSKLIIQGRNVRQLEKQITLYLSGQGIGRVLYFHQATHGNSDSSVDRGSHKCEALHDFLLFDRCGDSLHFSLTTRKFPATSASVIPTVSNLMVPIIAWLFCFGLITWLLL